MQDIASFVRNYATGDYDEIHFDWNGKHAAEFHDGNGEFRNAVVDYVVENERAAEVELLSDLFQAMADCSVEAWGCHRDFHRIGKQLLEKGGPEVLIHFARCFTLTFDTFGCCHAMSLDAITLNAVRTRGLELLAGDLSDGDRRALEMSEKLFGKIEEGTAPEGWAVLPPGTPIRNVKVVGSGKLRWARFRKKIKALLGL